MSANYLHLHLFSLFAEFAEHPKHFFRYDIVIFLIFRYIHWNTIFFIVTWQQKIHHLRLQSTTNVTTPPPRHDIPTQLVTWQQKKYIIFVCNQQRTSLPPHPPHPPDIPTQLVTWQQKKDIIFLCNQQRTSSPRTESPKTPGQQNHSKKTVHSTNKNHKNCISTRGLLHAGHQLLLRTTNYY